MQPPGPAASFGASPYPAVPSGKWKGLDPPASEPSDSGGTWGTVKTVALVTVLFCVGWFVRTKLSAYLAGDSGTAATGAAVPPVGGGGAGRLSQYSEGLPTAGMNWLASRDGLSRMRAPYGSAPVAPPPNRDRQRKPSVMAPTEKRHGQKAAQPAANVAPSGGEKAKKNKVEFFPRNRDDGNDDDVKKADASADQPQQEQMEEDDSDASTADPNWEPLK